MQDNANRYPQSKNVTTPFQLHGVLIRVRGSGVLLIGESGIGKSECALDLVAKGHRMIADDVVEVSIDGDALVGKAPSLTFELMEIRGLGIINIRELFGVDAVADQAQIDLCVELRTEPDVDRLKAAISSMAILGRELPKFLIPVSPGRNLSTLVETAVRLYMNQDACHTTEKLVAKQAALLSSGQ